MSSAVQGSKLEVDMLIGADHYWDLVTGAVYKNKGGPTAIQTRLGWVLSGPIAVTLGVDSAQCTHLSVGRLEAYKLLGQ